MTNPVADLGYAAVNFVVQLGRLAVFTGNITLSAVTPPRSGGAFLRRLDAFVNEIFKLGVLSLIIIVICGMAVGMVMGLQGYHLLVEFGLQGSLGTFVGRSLIQELGPVLTALLVIGRAGSATTAEIASMKATEQLDGLRMLSIDPIQLVIMPKALAMIFVVPLLTAIFIIAGLYGGYVVGVGFMGGDAGAYLTSLQSSITFRNHILGCFLKAIVFGILIGLISTFRGYTAKPNSEGVSSATTSTVVIGSVCILLFDYVVTALWGV